jgi:type I restriction enzyme S subunit
LARKSQIAEVAVPPTNGNLPQNWRRVRFGEVVRDVNEAERNPLEAGLERFVGLEHIEPENLHLKNWGILADGDVSFTKRFRKGQLLFGKRRAYQRKVAVAGFDGICSSDILTFEPSSDELLPELLPFIVQSDGFFEHALDTSSGSLSPRTRWSQLQDYEFTLPPKDEQRRIAEILWAADEVVEKLRRAQEQLDASIPLVYRHLFPEVNKAAEDYHKDQALKKEWTIKPFEQICEFITSGSRGWAEYYSVEGPIFIRSQNIRDQVLDFEDLQRVAPPPGTEGQRTRVSPGDVLITVTGNSVGNVAFVPTDLPEAYVSQHVGLARLIDPQMHRIIAAFLSPSGPGNCQILDAQYGQSKPGLSLLGVRQFLIPIPVGAKRDAVLRTIDACEDNRRKLQKHLVVSRDIRMHLINRMVSGEKCHVH